MYQHEQKPFDLTESIDRMCKRKEIEKRFNKISRAIGFTALAIFGVACIWALIIGQPIVILASFIIVGFVGFLCGGFDIKDIVFLMWWNSGKK
jgi:hypothetical protein